LPGLSRDLRSWLAFCGLRNARIPIIIATILYRRFCSSGRTLTAPNPLLEITCFGWSANRQTRI